jgi:acetoin utilization protein AcuC
VTYHEKFCQYDLGALHPFRGNRFINAKNFFENKGFFKSPNVLLVKPKAVSIANIRKAHSKEYIKKIYNLAEINGYYDMDTPVSKPILEALLLMIGGVIESGENIYFGKTERAFALGGGFHHAGKNYGGGFCIFNDVAILIEHLREKFKIKRILILDYDLHAGNGTYDIFCSDPNVLYISLHQDPRTIYPGKGFLNDIGEGAGEGYKINIPLPKGTGEQPYLKVLKEIFPPLAKEFGPEIIIANGGSDAHFADHLGNLQLTAKSYYKISRIISRVSEKVCNNKIVFLVCSGYNDLVLPYCWYALAKGAVETENTEGFIEDPFNPPSDPWQNGLLVEKITKKLKKILKQYWKCF